MADDVNEGRAPEAPGLREDEVQGERVAVESLPPARAAHMAWTCGVALVVLVVANVLAGRALGVLEGNLGYGMIDRKWALAGDPAVPAEALVLGDSTGNQGVVSDVLREATGDRVLNLCTLGRLVVIDDAWLLDESIRTRGAPRCVLVVHAHDAWRRAEPRADLVARLPRRWGYWRRADPPWRPDVGTEIDMAVARYAPLYHRAEAIRLELLRAVSERSDRRGFSAEFDATGYMRMEDVIDAEARVLRDVARQGPGFIEWDWSISEINLIAIRRIAAASREHEFRVFVALAPLAAPVLDLPGAREALADVRARLAALAHEEGMTFIDDIHTFPPSEMQSADHVAHDAAVEYTRRLADVLVRELAR